MPTELQDAIDTLADGDELRLMTRHNAADFAQAIAVVVKTARGVANGEQIYRCSQHGFRGTPRCNDNPACYLSLGVWVAITAVADAD